MIEKGDGNLEQSNGSSNLALEEKDNDEGCFCDKKQCTIGVASIAIGIGGFVVSLLL